jgi:hypothetical protein
MIARRQTQRNAPPPEARLEEGTLWACDLRDGRGLGEGLFNDARNVRCPDGRPETRKGVVKPGWANRTTAGIDLILSYGDPYGAGVFRDPNGTIDWQIIAADGYAWRTRTYNQAVSIPLPTGVRLLSRCTFVQAFNKLFCFRGRYLAPLRMTSFDDGFEDLLDHWSSASTYAQNAEVFYGPFVAVTALTRVGNTAIVETTLPHGYVTGADITISGATGPEYNGRFNITVIDDVTFTYFVTGAPTTPDAGTVTCSNMSYAYESLGTLYTLTSITRAASTATATKTAHGFANGQTVTIAGATQTEYNGTFVISNVAADTFDYPVTGAPATPATGTITVRNSLTIAGQSPDSAATSWQRIYDILPNADTALYTNNRLLVPTAYTPSSTGYNSSAVTYTKVDFLVATDIQDEIHFDFSDEFRINAGSSDEIVDLAKWSEDTVIIWKGKSWGVITGVALDLTDVRLDMRSKSYGLSARGAWAEAGENIVFVAEKRGFVSIALTQSGKLSGVDLPLSAPIQKLIDKIDWTQASTIKLANWNSHLYANVPIASENNYCILVFSFVSADVLQNPRQGWMPLDTGSALDVLEWFKLPLDGEERLFFLSTAGWVNLMEESEHGDQIEGDNDQGLDWAEITTRVRHRPQGAQLERLQSPLGASLALETFNPSYSITAHFEGVNKKTVLCTAVTKSNTRYTKPWNAAPWRETNENDDHATPYREDYRVHIGANLAAGVYTDTGIDVYLYLTGLTVGATYLFTAGDEDYAATDLLPLGTLISAGRFVATYSTMVLRKASGAGQATTATLYLASAPAVDFQTGVCLSRMQESLHRFRMSGRQGRSVALELTNTQGRIRWQGVLTRSRPGRQRQGVHN